MKTSEILETLPLCDLFDLHSGTIKFLNDIKIKTIGDFTSTDWSKIKCPPSFNMYNMSGQPYSDILNIIETLNLGDKCNFKEFEPVKDRQNDILLSGPACPQLVSFLENNAIREEYINKETGEKNFYYKYHTLLFDSNGSRLGWKKILDRGIVL